MLVKGGPGRVPQLRHIHISQSKPKGALSSGYATHLSTWGPGSNENVTPRISLRHARFGVTVADVHSVRRLPAQIEIDVPHQALIPRRDEGLDLVEKRTNIPGYIFFV